ncbi:MAG: hypothetical protein L3K07_08010 [Thermoplasmata archaeon]|nr:hypothetical protein [Thermoplasmata archaeon]
MGSVQPRVRRVLLALGVVGTLLPLAFLALAGGLGVPQTVAHPGLRMSGELRTAASPVQVTGFFFSPSTLSAGTQGSGQVNLSGGTQPYYLWFNNTPPGCAPSSTPVTITTPSLQFNCNPSSAGSYHVHLDVLDSSVPRTHANQSTQLTVTSNGGNNNGNGSGNNNGGNSKGNGSLSLPAGLLQLALIFGAVFLVSMLLIAAGTIATAVVLSRRLRQINETLAKSNAAPKDAKPPT